MVFECVSVCERLKREAGVSGGSRRGIVVCRKKKGHAFALGTQCKFDVLDGRIFLACTNPTGYTCRNNGLLYCNGLLPTGTTSSLTHSFCACVCACLTNCNECFFTKFTLFIWIYTYKIHFY